MSKLLVIITAVYRICIMALASERINIELLLELIG